MMAPQFVKAYVKSNKSDRADAEAVCEAVQRRTMRFVGVKTVAQQDQQSLHRVRSLAVAQRTAQVNQVRGVAGGAGDRDRPGPYPGAGGVAGDFGGWRERVKRCVSRVGNGCL